MSQWMQLPGKVAVARAAAVEPCPAADIVIGKWLGVCFFAIAGLLMNLSAFLAVMGVGGMIVTEAWPCLLLARGVRNFPLALFAAAIQLHISTVCRGVKEAHTYLSLVVFVPMVLGMFLVFFPAATREWFRFVPLIGQQLQLETMMKAGALPPFQSIVLGCLTAILSVAVLVATANRFERDEIIYGS